MISTLSLIRRLPTVFGDLKASLLAWRGIGQGLWPVSHWPAVEFDHYLSELYRLTLNRLATSLTREVSLPRWSPSGPGEVQSGEDCLALISFVLSVHENGRNTADAINFLHTIQSALTGLIYAEEPGELTIEEILLTY